MSSIYTYLEISTTSIISRTILVQRTTVLVNFPPREVETFNFGRSLRSWYFTTKNIFCTCGLICWFHPTFLAHPWVREGGDASEIPLDISVLSNMRQFVKYSLLKQFALRVSSFLSLYYLYLNFCGPIQKVYHLLPWGYFIILQALASTLDEEELADLKDQFHAIDVDKNGSISLEEMRQVFFFLSFCARGEKELVLVFPFIIVLRGSIILSSLKFFPRNSDGPR